MKLIIKYLLVCLAMMATTSGAFAEVEVDYESSFTANFGIIQIWQKDYNSLNHTSKYLVHVLDVVKLHTIV